LDENLNFHLNTQRKKKKPNRFPTLEITMGHFKIIIRK
jgi:hypothetical protein